MTNVTRIYLAWELKQAGIDVVVICDNMAGSLMKQGHINAVITGADRIAANGDTANKIGTYVMAVLAHRHGIPFYVAAPTSSIDPSCPCGDRIPIEERPGHEVSHVFDRQIAPTGVCVANPAFDVTPNELVTAIVTEKGVARTPVARTLPKLIGASPPRRRVREDARRTRPRKL